MSKLLPLLLVVALVACRRGPSPGRPDALVETPAALMDQARRYEERRDPAGLGFMAGAVDRLQARQQHHPAAEIARTQGRLAWHLSRYREAIAAFERSMTLARRAGDGVQEMKARRGIFTMLYELGDLRSARRVFEEAMKGSGRVDDWSRARLEFDRGLLAEAEGQLELAQAAFAAVLRSPAVKPGSREAWLANVNRLALALQQGDLDTARQVHGTIEELFTRPDVHSVPGSRIARGLYSAQLLRRTGQPRRALERLAEVEQEKTLGGQWAWMVALERGRVLAELGRQAEADAAFQASAATVEKLRGDQFDELRPWVLERRRAPFVALFERRARSGDAAAALSVFERTQGRTFLEAFAAQATADGASEATERFEWLRSLYPALKLSPVLGAPRTGRQLAAALGAVDALAFFEADDTIQLIAYRAGRPRVLRAARPLADIKRLVAAFVAQVGDVPTAEALGQALLPAGSLPRPGRTLYVIPSPLLARVPFAALRRNGRYLVEDHVLSQVPSLSALAAMGGNRAALGGPPAVLANARQNLPDAELEGQWVATHLGAGARLSLGPRATSTRLREAGGAGVLHLALHSGVGPTGPWLELADLRVPAQDLLGWRVAANLVVLASCASAATPSPGLWGSLVSSFLAGGSPSVVGSLWSTEDRISRELVQAFYQDGGAREPARALAGVQRRWLAAGRPVAHWAAFAAYGQARSGKTAARSGRSTLLTRQPAPGE